jgi:hypothetical protein
MGISFCNIAWASALGSFGLGCPLNLLLFFMIRRHTPSELRTFSGLLKQTDVIDLLLVALTFLIMPVSL